MLSTACMPPEGTMAGDLTYLRHVELTVDQEHRKGKIKVPIYRELLECFELIRDPEALETLIAEQESHTASLSKAEEAEKILNEIY